MWNPTCPSGIGETPAASSPCLRPAELSSPPKPTVKDQHALPSVGNVQARLESLPAPRGRLSRALSLWAEAALGPERVSASGNPAHLFPCMWPHHTHYQTPAALTPVPQPVTTGFPSPFSAMALLGERGRRTLMLRALQSPDPILFVSSCPTRTQLTHRGHCRPRPHCSWGNTPVIGPHGVRLTASGFISTRRLTGEVAQSFMMIKWDADKEGGI